MGHLWERRAHAAQPVCSLTRPWASPGQRQRVSPQGAQGRARSLAQAVLIDCRTQGLDQRWADSFCEGPERKQLGLRGPCHLHCSLRLTVRAAAGRNTGVGDVPTKLYFMDIDG